MLDNLKTSVRLLVLLIEACMEKGIRVITHDILAKAFTVTYDEPIRGSGSRRSIRENLQRALDYLVHEGHMYFENNAYCCAYRTLKQFREAKCNIMDEDRILSYEMSVDVFLPDDYNIYRLDMTSQDLDLDIEEDEDDDDLDFEGIIKFRKEMYDEPATSDSKKNEDEADEGDDDMDELDKLLKEVSNEIKIQYIVKSSEDAKAYVARRCETKDEAKQLCFDIRDGINGETIVHFLDAYIYFDRISDDEYNEFRRDNA